MVIRIEKIEYSKRTESMNIKIVVSSKRTDLTSARAMQTRRTKRKSQARAIKLRRRHGCEKDIFSILPIHSCPVSGRSVREGPEPDSAGGWFVHGAVSRHLTAAPHCH